MVAQILPAIYSCRLHSFRGRQNSTKRPTILQVFWGTNGTNSLWYKNLWYETSHSRLSVAI